jgi:Na+/H+ antiporter NhaC
MNSAFGNIIPFAAGVTSGALALSALSHLSDTTTTSEPSPEQHVEQGLFNKLAGNVRKFLPLPTF